MLTKVALLGHGVVGGGVSRILAERGESLGLELAAICTKNPEDNFPYSHLLVEAEEIWKNPEIKIVFECIGGVGIALTFVKKALASGKSVITANKEMIAKHFEELHTLAAENNVFLLFEAAVGGGIPVLSAMRAGLGGEEIQEITGILNGTTNFILTKMEGEREDFADALVTAQSLGYAEADPTADVEGFDALYKLVILSTVGFGVLFRPEDVSRMGISRLRSFDFEYARGFGGKIKLVGTAKKTNDGVFAEVSPMIFPEDSSLAKTQGVLNAIEIRGAENTAGNFLSGEGAGRAPTACAMVSDAVTITRGRPILPKAPLPQKPTESWNQPFYVRFSVLDRPGIVGEIGSIFGRHDISLDAISQLPHQTGDCIHFALTTFTASRNDFFAAMREVENADFNAESPLFFPIAVS